MTRQQALGYLKYGNGLGIDAALDALKEADDAELAAQDAHEMWREANAVLAQDQYESAREGFGR